MLNIDGKQIIESEKVEEYNLKKATKELEKKILCKALKEFGSTRNAAKHLGIDQSTVVKKCKKFNIIISDEKNHRTDEKVHHI